MLNMGEDGRVDKLGERHWRIYSTVRKIDGSWGLAVQHRSPALCSLMTQGRDGEERERVQLTKAVTQQRLTPHCKAMIRQFKENTRLEGNGKRKYDLIKLCWESWLSIGKKKKLYWSSSRYLNSYIYSFEEEQKWMLSSISYIFFLSWVAYMGIYYIIAKRLAYYTPGTVIGTTLL